MDWGGRHPTSHWQHEAGSSSKLGTFKWSEEITSPATLRPQEGLHEALMKEMLTQATVTTSPCPTPNSWHSHRIISGIGLVVGLATWVGPPLSLASKCSQGGAWHSGRSCTSIGVSSEAPAIGFLLPSRECRRPSREIGVPEQADLFAVPGTCINSGSIRDLVEYRIECWRRRYGDGQHNL